MILLYIILLNYDKIPGEDLLRDVEKSHEILRSMKDASVARRSAALMLEVIEVAKTYLSRRRQCMQLSLASSSPSGFDTMGNDCGITDGVSHVPMNENYNWQRTLFAEDFLGLRRVDMLSTLIDPSTLVNFAAENTFSTQNELFPNLGDYNPFGM
jgi:hypothetical protein